MIKGKGEIPVQDVLEKHGLVKVEYNSYWEERKGEGVRVTRCRLFDSTGTPIVSGFAGQVSEFISSVFPSFDNFINTLEELFDSFTP